VGLRGSSGACGSFRRPPAGSTRDAALSHPSNSREQGGMLSLQALARTRTVDPLLTMEQLRRPHEAQIAASASLWPTPRWRPNESDRGTGQTAQTRREVEPWGRCTPGQKPGSLRGRGFPGSARQSVVERFA
jgi:hypothetical protein